MTATEKKGTHSVWVFVPFQMHMLIPILQGWGSNKVLGVGGALRTRIYLSIYLSHRELALAPPPCEDTARQCFL